jgi:hypothetical protein
MPCVKCTFGVAANIKRFSIITAKRSAGAGTKHAGTKQWLIARFDLVCAEIIAWDRASLDLQWEQHAEERSNASTSRTLMREILTDLQEAMKEFAAGEDEIHK